MWRVDVSPDASLGIQEFDPVLKEELIAHVELVADDPREVLRLPRLGIEPDYALIYEYDSTVVQPLHVVLLFGSPDDRARRITLVAIIRTSLPPDLME
jgi:hypothetical protein